MRLKTIRIGSPTIKAASKRAVAAVRVPIWVTLATLLASTLFVSAANARETIQIDRSIILRAGPPSNQYPPGAYQVLRADDGDYIVSGAVNLSDTEAWASRLDPTGHARWQFIDGPADAWKKGTPNLNRFVGAIVLPDNSTLLCGTSHLPDHKPVVLLIYISTDGKLIKEIHLIPDGYEQASLGSCFKWGDGFGLIGVAREASPDPRHPKFAGWLCKLRFPGTIVWNKFDDNFLSGDVIETPEHGLLIMTSNSKGTKISRVDSEAVLEAQHDVPAGAYFIRPVLPASQINVGYMVDTFQTEFARFDRDLRDSPHVVKVNNVGIKKGYALADGSLIVFGSAFTSNAVPNVARIYKDSSLTNFAAAPPMEGGWINDAVPDGLPNHYVSVRIAGTNSVMSWLSVHSEGGVAAAAMPARKMPSAVQATTTSDGWPIPPDRHLPFVKSIPSHDQIVLEVRFKNRTGVPNEIAVLNLTKESESKWDVLGEALRDIPATSFGSQAGWAPIARKLLYATHNSAYLVSIDGSASELHLQMPATASLFDGMSGYALSADGLQVAYTLLIRDQSQKSQIPGDSLGKLYTDLMVQRTEGSPPASVWNDGTSVLNSAWRPDGAAIAHADSNNNLVVSDLDAKTLWSVHAGPAHQNGGIADVIQEIRWDPTGQRLAFLMGIPIPKVFVVNADGTGVKEVAFRNSFGTDRDLQIAKFAWSPDGRKFVFRSRAGSKCNYLALGYKIQTGHYPCIYSWNLSTADADGSHVKTIGNPDYEFGELFWIQ
jgi:hypothetical protein